MQTIGQNQTGQALIFGPIVATDGVTPITGLVSGTNLTVTLSKNGAAFGAPAGAVSEVGNGYYAIAGNAADAGALGPLIIHWATTGQPASIASETAFMVVAYDPLDANALGLAYVAATNTAAAAIDAALPGNFGALAISDSGEVTAAGSGDGPTVDQIVAAILQAVTASQLIAAATAISGIRSTEIPWRQGVVFTYSILDSNGNPIDPSTLFFEWSDTIGNTGSVAIDDLTHVTTGVFSYTLTPQAEGTAFTYRWVSTNPDTATNDLSLRVLSSQFAQ